MTTRTLARELLLWLPVGVIPILNGAIRLGLYARWLGEPRASMVSSALDLLAGEPWLLVSLAVFAAPIFGRWIAARAPARAPTPAA